MRIIGTFIVTLLLVAGALLVVAPRLDWSALGKPGPMEDKAAEFVLGGWIDRNADSQKNPIAESPETLKLGKANYNEHCSMCHGIDGGGKNRIEASFYPPIPKLTGDTEEMSDGQMYFIVAKGIRYSAMPGFEKDHSADEIWQMILWVRHLGHLSPAEKAQIEAQAKVGVEEHSEKMGGDAKAEGTSNGSR